MLAKREYVNLKNLADFEKNVQRTLQLYENPSFDPKEYIAGWNNVRKKVYL